MQTCTVCAQGINSGKRKASTQEGEEGTAAGKASGQSQKVVKRAQGHTPSCKGPAPGVRGQSPAQKGPGPSPLRHLNGSRGAQGPSRLAQSTHVSDIENAAKATNTLEACSCYSIRAGLGLTGCAALPSITIASV